jgi:gluconokinase
LQARLSARQGHFAGATLLDSQLAALEPPTDAVNIDAGAPVETVVANVCRALHLRC